MGEFRYEKDADGIVTITMDMDGPVNSMNAAFGPLFAEAADRVSAEDGLTGVVITSAKDTFFAGGDLNMLAAVPPGDEQGVFDMVEGIKASMRKLEKLPVPVVAAINGAALGGGFEICLACNRRIALDDRKVKIGQPEVSLGLLPGGGGCVRMTYLLGLEGAMPFLLEGRQLDAAHAVDAGLIHETVGSVEELLPRAKAWIKEVQGDAVAAAQPWDTKGYRIPGGPSISPANAPKIAGAAAMLYQKTRGLLPAPAMILDIMVEAAGKPDFDSATRYESRKFAALVPRPETKNMISAFFFNLNKVNNGASRPKDVTRTKVGRVGILGAGMMGQGIAYSSAMAGIEVVLKDVTIEGAEKGKAYTETLLNKRVQKGRMTDEKRDEVLALITPTTDASDLAGCDLVIEAVFERIDVKNKVLAEHEELIGQNTVWGSNTSTLPITRLAKASKRPENFIGLHFFSPVDKMPLLEIIVGEQTSDETLARAFDYALQIRKTPIVVNDATGFYTSRTIGTKIYEAVEMVAEGLDPVRIDNLGRSVGFPVGMLSLLDELKLHLLLDVHDTQLEMGLTKPEDQPNRAALDLLREMVETHNRRSRAEGGAFFDYTDQGKRLWPGLEQWRKPGHEIPDEDIKDRMLFRPVLETLKCLEEGVLRSVPDANIGSIMGIGAPVHTGGYVQFINTYGIDRFTRRCEELAQKYGPRFAPPGILKQHAAENRPFV